MEGTTDMPTKTSEPERGGSGTQRSVERALSYDAALAEYTAAMDLLGRKDYAGARERFLAVQKANPTEPELAERAGMYAKICDQRLSPAAVPSSLPEELYRRGVVLSNAGRPAEAIELLTKALEERPGTSSYLYARASAWALKGTADRAVTDLRQAIAADPAARFQAANDPDFEGIREEPSFIDIIEPTPTGA